MRPTFPFLALAISALFASCIIAIGDRCKHCQGCDSRQHAPEIGGSGKRAAEVRAVDAFSRISAHGSFTCDVTVGGEQSVEVSGDDNLLAYLRTEVADGALVVRMQPGRYSQREDLRIQVRVPTLSSLSLAGAAKARARGVSATAFEVRAAGSADVEVEGSVDTLTASVTGSGKMDLTQLVARKASVELAGSGDLRLQVTEELQGKVDGSGDVEYRGGARVTSWSTVGSGNLRRLDP